MRENQPVGASILEGVDEAIDKWLGLTDGPRYRRGTRIREKKKALYSINKAAQDLSRNAKSAEQCALSRGDILNELLKIIESNWENGGRRNPSRNTWVLRQRTAPTDPKKKPEETLERVMAEALGETWSNQLATCSGLIEGRREGRRSVDLVHDLGGSCYEFIELKYKNGDRGRFGSNNPLHATWEIVCYSLLYVLARRHLRGEVERPVLAAKEVQLAVLAPSGYYRYKRRNGDVHQFDLRWLETFLNRALNKVANDTGLKMSFGFQQFTERFNREYKPMDRKSSLSAFSKSGFDFREPVYRR